MSEMLTVSHHQGRLLMCGRDWIHCAWDVPNDEVYWPSQCVTHTELVGALWLQRVCHMMQGAGAYQQAGSKTQGLLSGLPMLPQVGPARLWEGICQASPAHHPCIYLQFQLAVTHTHFSHVDKAQV